MTSINRRRSAHLALLACLAAGLLSGCATSASLWRESRVKWYLRQHPAVQPEIQKALLAGELCLGMTPDEVRLSWGSPSQRESDTSAGAPVTTWYYSKRTTHDRDEQQSTTLYDIDLPVANLVFTNGTAGPILAQWTIYAEEAQKIAAEKKLAGNAAATEPTRTLNIQVTPGVDISQWPSLNVAGIILGVKGRGAVINNDVIREGQSVSGVEVVAVTQQGVYLRYNSQVALVPKGTVTGPVPKSKKK